MGLINFALDKLDPYEPEGIFSFEFIDRNTETTISELLFLLPPESYSIKNNYRVNVTKTLTGFYVDDFGNDIKDITLAGSLYSYWISVLPKFTGKGIRGQVKNFSKKIKSGVEVGKNILSGNFAGAVGGSISLLQNSAIGEVLLSNELSGLQEFFKLRYILDRFRDDYDFRTAPRNIPGIAPLEIYASQGKKLYDDIKIVYHDYDDYNHYEVVINGFTFDRNKNDPLTVNYNITMQGLKTAYPFGTASHPTGSLIKKETIASFIGKVRTVFFDKLNEIAEIIDYEVNQITGQIKDVADLIFDITLSNDVENAFVNFLGQLENIEYEAYNEISNPSSVIALVNSAEILAQAVADAEDIKLEKQGINKEDYESGISNPIETTTDAVFFETTNALNQFCKSVKIIKKLNLTDKEEEKTYHTLKVSDTLSRLSVKYYGSVGFEKVIAEENKITDKDIPFSEGIKLTIPNKKKTIKKTKNNLIYYNKDYTNKDFNYYVNRNLGIDIVMPMRPVGNGKMELNSGYNNFIDAVEKRFKYEKGSLNPIHIFYGSSVPVGDIPKNIYIEKVISSLLFQAQADPRVSNVEFKQVTVKANKLIFEIAYKDIATDTYSTAII